MDDVTRRAFEERAKQLQRQIEKARRDTERARAMVVREIEAIKAALENPRNEGRRAELEARLRNAEQGLRAIG